MCVMKQNLTAEFYFKITRWCCFQVHGMSYAVLRIIFTKEIMIKTELDVCGCQVDWSSFKLKTMNYIQLC